MGDRFLRTDKRFSNLKSLKKENITAHFSDSVIF